MTIFGKSLSEYVSFSRLFLILIPLVGLLRLGLSLQGVPVSTVRWFSMSVVGIIAVIYYAIRVHTSGFGSYKQLFALLVLQGLVSQVFIILAIVLTMLTGVENIFSAPEFGGSQWIHVIAHLFLAIPFGALVSWGIGSLILLIARKVAPSPQTA